jgi:hypothetical protein
LCGMVFFGLKVKIPLRAVYGIGEEASEAAVRRGAGKINTRENRYKCTGEK